MSLKLTMKNNLSTILENSHLKPVLYNSVLSVGQFVALHKLKPLTEESIVVSKKKIIIHSVHGTYLSAIYKEGALALALRLYGHNAKMLFCDKRLKSCCALFTIDHPASKRDCHNCVRFSEQFCSQLNIPRLIYHDFCNDYENIEQLIRIGLNSRKANKETVYKGVKIGRHAETGTRRYFKGKQVQTDVYHKHFISKLIDASIVVDVAEKVLEKERPDLIVTSHSCYAEFGPFSEFFKNAGVPVFTWFTGYKPNTLVFDLPEVGKNFEKYLEKDCPTDSTDMYDKNRLDMFMRQRKQGMGESSLYGFKVTNKDLGLPDDKRIFGIFPNAPWDADPSCNTLFFDSIFDWVLETIKFFEKRSQYLLIVKTHPSEKLYNSKTTVYDLIKEKYPELQKNIILLPPDTVISAYDLFPHLSVGIVSNTTTGLEMLLENVPVITVGEAHYRDKGFTYDPKTKEEYFRILDSGYYTSSNREKMQRYAYYYFIKSFLPFDVFYKKNFLDIGYKFRTLDELKENESVKHIIDCVTENKLFQDW